MSLPAPPQLPAAPTAAASAFDADRYNGRMTTLVLLSCMVATMGGVIVGYDVGISGGVTSMEPFLKEMFPAVYARMKEEAAEDGNYCRFDSHLLTSFTSSLYVAGLFASLLASWVTRVFGRRPTMVAGGAAFLAGAALSGAAINVWMLLLGRVLLGVGVGFANQAVPLYLSEMAPPQYRGAVSNGFQFSIGIGFILASLINFGTQKKGSWGWRISLALAAAPALFFTLGASFLPETPNSLIQSGVNFQKVVSTLQKIRGTADVVAELNDMISAASIPHTVGRPFRMIVQRCYRPQLVMAIMIPFFQQVTGFNLIAFYAPVLFRTIGFQESASLMAAVGLGLIGTGSTVVSMMAVDRLGRRAMFMIGGVQMIVSQVAVGGAMARQLGDQGVMSKGYACLVLVLMCVYVVGFELSWGPLGWLVPSEILPLQVRSAGQSIVVAVSFLLTFVVAEASLTLLCHLKAAVFFFFGGWVAVMTVFVYLLLPETGNRPIEQMDRVWRVHWFWKKIVGDEWMQDGYLGHV